MQLFKILVRLPDKDYVAPEIKLDRRSCHFNGCISAIDGTHISAHIRRDNGYRSWRNRKGRISQNVLVAVKFDGSFTYMLAGAKGSMHNAKLLFRALNRHYLRIPKARYYLGDAAFSSTRGIVTLFGFLGAPDSL